VTILSIHRLLTYHYVFGFILLGPLVLKLASTGYRFVRYYTGDPEYGRAGPPRPLLRLLAPLLVASTLGVFATGVALAFAGRGHASLLITVHKASFVVWFGCTTLHVLAYLNRAVRHVVADLAGRGRERPMRRRRLVLAAASVALGLAFAVPAASWAQRWSAAAASRCRSRLGPVQLKQCRPGGVSVARWEAPRPSGPTPFGGQ
jgi:hypothetical protein